MDALTRSIQGEVPWCMLFMDDVVLIDESQQGINDKLEGNGEIAEDVYITILGQLSFFTVLVVFLISSNSSTVYGHCLGDQKALLLKLKNDLTFDSSMSAKLVRWDQNTDCCQWPGVSCDREGHVLVLELDNETISSGVDSTTSLFDLQYLEKLNLAYNLLDAIPMELSTLTQLVSLDLSYNYFLKLESPDLKTLVGNLLNLGELYLDDVNLNLNGSPLDPALLNLSFLGVLRLDHNNMSVIDLEFLANFTKLTTLSLLSCNLHGSFPTKIIQVQTLQELDLYETLISTLPEFPQRRALRELTYSIKNGKSHRPSSSRLVIQWLYCVQNSHLSGEVHEFSDASSSVLDTLDLSNNHLNGSIPWSIFKLKRLSQLSLSSNSFSGTINIEAIKGLPRLTTLDLSYNNLRIESDSTSFPFPVQMSNLRLASCQLQKFPDLKNQSLLFDLDLSDNKTEGEIPSWVWTVGYLNLSHNLLKSLEEPYHMSRSRAIHPFYQLIQIALQNGQVVLLTFHLPIINLQDQYPLPYAI
ncbi:hypothetical protein T459_25618 [Capsicum annuum]|uniref:Leucine-rich repeat-containing N-terminal plant-type domain-containing protein n=1 Tax=Capsicum annuum TaxID=4072 RepID=A0A2G2YLC0_CAPAN|nr:putative wall-associated receptor kinase 5-like [Capsicum annuum]PHT70514.1 hypothetical protein T459_25618 [Capsicum annuum]